MRSSASESGSLSGPSHTEMEVNFLAAASFAACHCSSVMFRPRGMKRPSSLKMYGMPFCFSASACDLMPAPRALSMSFASRSSMSFLLA